MPPRPSLSAESHSERLKAFVAYWRELSGDEKGETRVLCDRLVRAFGHKRDKETGATLEHRVKQKGEKGGTGFADVV